MPTAPRPVVSSYYNSDYTYKKHNDMKKTFTLLMMLLLTAVLTASAQQRRPIDNRHPMWMIHIDVWNYADPQKIIDLIPADIRPYVCMNLSLSCSYKTDESVYEKPHYAFQTYKSWATVCQRNGMWFTCQPASGGHTHIQDDDLVTFEYFFKHFPNFLGWNYAEQFWGFEVAGNKSSSTKLKRWALFAKLVEMSHKYGGLLTISWCGGTYHMDTNPIAELKNNQDFLAACQKYPEAILFLYKYTHASSFYNNESVCWGPFVSGLTKNYGVRYDNCGWNDTTSKLFGENSGHSYPGAAGIGTVMEQTCVNGGAVWDGPELIWSGECFTNENNTQDGDYTRRNWGTFPNFNGIWIDMFRKIIDGTMYIPTREEVLEKTKIVVVNDLGCEYNGYTAWDDLYNGVYLQTDPFNQRKESQWGYGQWYNNLCYFKSTGRYGAIPIVTGLYDDAAKAIPVKVKRSNYTSLWNTQTKKVNDFNGQYPQVSTGDLYVNRYRNQLVTYTPYSYANAKTTAQATIPLQYNTCSELLLQYGKLSSGIIHEYADSITAYLNNFRADTTTNVTDKIIVTGATAQPTYKVTKHATATSEVSSEWDADTQTFTLTVSHNGPLDIAIYCSGDGTDRKTDVVPNEPLSADLPKQPDTYEGAVIIEAEDMDFKNIKTNVTHSYSTNWGAYRGVRGHAGLGFMDMGTNTAGTLRYKLKVNKAGKYRIGMRYMNTDKAGELTAKVGLYQRRFEVEKTAANEWKTAVATVETTLTKGSNNVVYLYNKNGINLYVDQLIFTPVELDDPTYEIAVRDAEGGQVTADKTDAAEGDSITLTVTPDEHFALKELKLVNSVFYTMGKTIPVTSQSSIKFAMPNDNVTILPVFEDKTAVYKMDFGNVLAGTLPPGWKCTQENSTVHAYPSSYDNGARVFNGFTGYQGKGLYWREVTAEYGRQNDYLLTLEPGSYKLTYAMAAWKGAPQYKVSILNATTGSSIASTSSWITAAPNADGKNTANLSSATPRTLDFTVTQAGNYVIQFSCYDQGGYQEYLLLECRVNITGTTGIRLVNASNGQHPVIYDATGRQRNGMQRGLNIVRSADGTTRKIWKK